MRELFNGVSVTNELMVTLRDILRNRDIYANKVDGLAAIVTGLHSMLYFLFSSPNGF